MEGGARLSGLARVGGAKNAVLALLAGALACREPVLLRGVPYLRDVLSMIDVLRSVGAVVHLDARGPGTVLVDASELTSDAPDPDAVRKLRASFFAAGPILGRLGSVRMPLPGDAPSAPARWTSTSPRSRPWARTSRSPRTAS